VREKMGLAKFSVIKTIKPLKKPNSEEIYINMQIGKAITRQTPN